MLEDPSFSFLHAQEFFLSETASCDRPLDVQKPLRVMVNEKAKRAQLEQRFVAKHVKDSLMSLSKMDISRFKNMRQAVLPEVSESEGVPAVELHMYPESFDVNSTWRVLMIPRLQELFDRTMFLCSPAASSPCIAKLSFNRLPPRLMHPFWKWSPSLDPLRSAPHRLMFFLDLLLLAMALFMFWLVLHPLEKLLRMAWDMYNSPRDFLNKKAVLESTLPKTWMLTQHAYVYKAPGEKELVCEDALDACTDVKAPYAMHFR